MDPDDAEVRGGHTLHARGAAARSCHNLISAMTTQEALSQFREFMESTPPYVSKNIAGLYGYHHPQADQNPMSFPLPQIELHCETDGGPRYFTSTGQLTHVFASGQSWQFVHYRCKNCGHQVKTFALAVQHEKGADAVVMKLGEFPPFGAVISPRVQKLLGVGDLELYRKGMRAEAQGLGIGAATYFRRVVDNQWKQLVEEIRDAATRLGIKDVKVFDAALQETKFSRAVEMLKDAIPSKLLILDGENPLTLLYKSLSVQLHVLNDEECLQLATDIQLVLTVLLENIADVLKDQAELKGAAARLKPPKAPAQAQQS